MPSKHAITLALLLGAFAFIFVTGCFALLEISKITNGKVVIARSREKRERPPENPLAPEGFTIFAVPQDNYVGTIYVQATADLNRTLLKVYPLDYSTGNLAPSIINIESNYAELSANQEKIAIVTGQTLAIYDLALGRTIQSWSLTEEETWPKELSGAWTNDRCFAQEVWYRENIIEKSFCLE